jgi:hypothetical protein
MNNIRKYTLLIFTLISISVAAQLNLNINITYPAPSYLSDWAYTKSGVATLVLNQENQLLKIKFQTQLQTLDGTPVATSNNANAATYSIRTGANVFSLDKLLQLENLQFTDGNIIRSIQTSGKLPAGNYQLCIQVLGSIAGTTREIEMLKVPVCRPFTQAGYQLPNLLTPLDKTWLDAATAKSVITFRWSSIVPRTQEHVTYRLQVYEVKDDQLPMQALRSNMPILNTDVVNTQYIWRPQLDFSGQEGYVFIWTIQTLDSKGNPVSTADGLNLGWSEPQVFGVCNKTKGENPEEACGNGRKLE